MVPACYNGDVPEARISAADYVTGSCSGMWTPVNVEQKNLLAQQTSALVAKCYHSPVNSFSINAF